MSTFTWRAVSSFWREPGFDEAVDAAVRSGLYGGRYHSAPVPATTYRGAAGRATAAAVRASSRLALGCWPGRSQIIRHSGPCAWSDAVDQLGNKSGNSTVRNIRKKKNATYRNPAHSKIANRSRMSGPRSGL
jgi:hypothetical protein